MGSRDVLPALKAAETQPGVMANKSAAGPPSETAEPGNNGAPKKPQEAAC